MFIFKSSRSWGQESQGIDTTCLGVKQECLAREVLAASRRGPAGVQPWTLQSRESTPCESRGRPARAKFRCKGVVVSTASPVGDLQGCSKVNMSQYVPDM